MAFGLAMAALGVIGFFLPVMPSTVFFLIALWAFSRSSRRFHTWLYTHPRFGPPLQDWHERRAIPLRAKVWAVSLIAVSFTIVVFVVTQFWLLIAVGGVLAAVAVFIVTRPHGLAPSRSTLSS